MLGFRNVFRMLEQRIRLLAALPVRSLGTLAFARKVEEIGRFAADVAETKSPPA
jgi:hypothetical protein